MTITSVGSAIQARNVQANGDHDVLDDVDLTAERTIFALLGPGAGRPRSAHLSTLIRADSGDIGHGHDVEIEADAVRCDRVTGQFSAVDTYSPEENLQLMADLNIFPGTQDNKVAGLSNGSVTDAAETGVVFRGMRRSRPRMTLVGSPQVSSSTNRPPASTPVAAPCGNRVSS